MQYLRTCSEDRSNNSALRHLLRRRRAGCLSFADRAGTTAVMGDSDDVERSLNGKGEDQENVEDQDGEEEDEVVHDGGDGRLQQRDVDCSEVVIRSEENSAGNGSQR